ncbi:MAG: hypothetical protein DRP08_08060 [Candidatus Aenigmatarchaeota archaeon]|nr:MAG: hypothetical protein DRP08_08060 [Candidatus Aenigmarchaeota archaeon]
MEWTKDIWGEKVEVERNGKRPEVYTLYKYVGKGLYLATKDSGGNPKIVYLMNLKKERKK